MSFHKKNKLVVISSMVLIITGIIYIGIQLSNVHFLLAFYRKYLLIVFNSCLCLILVGAGYMLLQFNNNKKARAFLVALSLLLTVICALTILGDIFHFNAGIDKLLVPGGNSNPIAYPLIHTQMLPGTAVVYLCLGLALIGFCTKIRFVHILSQYLLHAVSVICSILLIGFVYSDTLLINIQVYALNYLWLGGWIVTLSIAASFLHPSLGLTSLFSGSLVGNKMARRLFLMMTVSIFVFGLVKVKYLSFTVWQFDTGLSLFVVCVLLAALLIIWHTANWLNKVDLRRIVAENELKVLNGELERRVQERSLEIQKKEARYRLLIEQASDAIYVVDLEGYFMDVNNKICQMTGYSREELLGMNVEEIIDPEELKKDPLTFGRVGVLAIMRERTLKRKDGTTFTAEINVKGFDDNMVLIIARDVTGRKQAEKKLLESEARYRVLFYYSPLPKLIYDMETLRIVDVNEVVVSSYGYSAEEFANMTIYDLAPREDMLFVHGAIEKLGDKRGIIHFGIYNHLRKDRSIIKADITGYRLNYQGRDCMMVVCSDVTEREKTLLELKKLNINLEKQARELAISNTELEQFAYVASHDLQEPLRMITSFLAKLETKYDSLLDKKGKQYIHFATDGAKRMRQLILDLLEFSRVGRTKLKIENVDLTHLIKGVLGLYQVKIMELDAKVNLGLLPTCSTYKIPLMQVFQNLIDNSLKYHKSGVKPVIDIGFTEKALEYEFSVSDNGIGISSEFYNKIFIVFQRLHNKDEYSGTGMGLAITKKIVENMGGRIWVDSAEGIGSTFYFTIPKNS